MPVTITCSECNRRLKVPEATVGKKIRCPACKAVIAVRAGEEDPAEEKPARPTPKVAVASSKPPALPKKAPTPQVQGDEDEDEEDEKPKEKKGAKGGKGKKKQSGVALFLALGLVGLVVVGGGVLAWIMLQGGPNSTSSSKVAGRCASVDPTGGNPSFKPTAERLQGRWAANVELIGPVAIDFNSDGHFSLTVEDAMGKTAVTGEWKITGIGLDSGRLVLSKPNPASKYVQNDEVVIFSFGGTPEKPTLIYQGKELKVVLGRPK